MAEPSFQGGKLPRLQNPKRFSSSFSKQGDSIKVAQNLLDSVLESHLIRLQMDSSFLFVFINTNKHHFPSSCFTTGGTCRAKPNPGTQGSVPGWGLALFGGHRGHQALRSGAQLWLRWGEELVGPGSTGPGQDLSPGPFPAPPRTPSPCHRVHGQSLEKQLLLPQPSWAGAGGTSPGQQLSPSGPGSPNSTPNEAFLVVQDLQ